MKKYMVEYLIDNGDESTKMVATNDTLTGAMNAGLLLAEAFTVVALSTGKWCEDCSGYHPIGGNLLSQNESNVSGNALGLN